MEYREKVRNFLNKYITNHKLDDNENIFEKGLVSSLFAMQLVMFLEKEFSISISNDELDIDNFKDVDSITALVETKLG